VRRRLGVAVLLVAVLATLALVVRWSFSGAGYATPAACLDAYCEACKAGDVGAYERCLTEPLWEDVRRRHPDAGQLGTRLRSSMQDVKSWAQLPGSTTARTADVEVDEVRTGGTRRRRFRLEQVGRGWRIAAIGAPHDLPGSIPFGTHVSQNPDAAAKGEVP